MTTTEIRSIVNASDSHFFSRGTMRFFNSRLEGAKYGPMAGTESGSRIYFVTSEQYDDGSPRLYTVRAFDRATGRHTTVGEFQQYRTLAGARTAMYAAATA